MGEESFPPAALVAKIRDEVEREIRIVFRLTERKKTPNRKKNRGKFFRIFRSPITLEFSERAIG
jgi:hypothetical protein